MSLLRSLSDGLRSLFHKKRVEGELNEELRAIIMRNEDASVITAAAYRNGMRNLRDDGWEKVARGVTTSDEVMRVTQEF